MAYTFARIVKEEKRQKQLPKKAMRFVETEKTERPYSGKNKSGHAWLDLRQLF